MTKEENLRSLRERGMSHEEAKRFLDSPRVILKGIQLPPDRAKQAIEDLVHVGVIAGPVRFYMYVPEDRTEETLEIIQRHYPEIGITQGKDFTKADVASPEEVARILRKGFDGHPELDKSSDKES